jgi:hypothetical protein
MHPNMQVMMNEITVYKPGVETQPVKLVTAEEAVDIVEQILPPGTLTSVKALVFRQSWAGKEYAEIAKESGYDYGYIRDAGAQLWRSLSEVLREPVKKKTFRTLLQQRFSDQSMVVNPQAIAPGLLRCPEVPEFPGGPIPLHSKFYIEHAAVEAKVYTEISKPGALLHIKAAEKMGKSSLLLRIANYAINLGYHTVSLDFRQADRSVFANLTQFLRWFCTTISYQAGLEPKLDEYWDTNAGSKISCKLYFTRYLLKQLNAPLVLILNEIDQILQYPQLSQEVLLVLRSWYEEAKHVEVLQHLRLVLAHSADIYIPLNSNSSFLDSVGHVGRPIELPDFSVLQVRVLAQRYGLTWMSSTSVQQLMDLVGGHPYLIQLALYHLWNQDVTLEQLLREASTPVGIYSDHLQSYLAVLQANLDLAAAFKHLITMKSAQ